MVGYYWEQRKLKEGHGWGAPRYIVDYFASCTQVPSRVLPMIVILMTPSLPGDGSDRYKRGAWSTPVLSLRKAGYMDRVMVGLLALRKTTSASPSNPVPSRANEAGSGVAMFSPSIVFPSASIVQLLPSQAAVAESTTFPLSRA